MKKSSLLLYMNVQSQLYVNVICLQKDGVNKSRISADSNAAAVYKTLYVQYSVRVLCVWCVEYVSVYTKTL